MIIIGIDEVGRGCWAGPVVAAAVALLPATAISGLNDSKKLSSVTRTALDRMIREQASVYDVGWVWPEAIDDNGLTQAVRNAMEQAYAEARRQLAAMSQGDEPLSVIIDGNYNFLSRYSMSPADRTQVTTMVRADGLVPAVSAASIIAKVARDKYMAEVAAAEYPQYGFETHVGYGTTRHLQALQEHGVTPLHRRSYKPIQAFLLQSGA